MRRLIIIIIIIIITREFREPRPLRCDPVVEVGRYIADMDVSVSYRHFRYRCFLYIDIVLVTSEISEFLDILSNFLDFLMLS